MKTVESLRSEGFAINHISKLLKLKALHNTEIQRTHIADQIKSFDQNRRTGSIDTYGAFADIPNCISEGMKDIYFEEQFFPFSFNILSGKNNDMTEFNNCIMRLELLKSLGFESTKSGLCLDSWIAKSFENINYKIAKSPKISSVYLVRTAWPNPEKENIRVEENLVVAQIEEELHKYLRKVISKNAKDLKKI